jgi:hypothetical protein
MSVFPSMVPPDVLVELPEVDPVGDGLDELQLERATEIARIKRTERSSFE